MIPVVGLLHLVRVAVDRYLKIRLPRMRKKMPKVPKLSKLPKIVASLRSAFINNAWYFQD